MLKLKLKLKLKLTAILLLLAPIVTFAADNAELRSIKDADQADRRRTVSPEHWREVWRRDGERRGRVLEILSAGQLSTAWDYYNAAIVLQHGASAEDIRLAHSLATLAATLDPGHKHAKWLMAASWDRLMICLKQPQWYGTQSALDVDGKFVLLPVLPNAVTDMDRAALGVPPLADSMERIDSGNRSR